MIQYNKVKCSFGVVVMKNFDFIDALSIGDNLSKNIAGLNEISDLSLPLTIMDSFEEETKKEQITVAKTIQEC